MKKVVFEEPKFDLIVFSVADVVETASGGYGPETVPDDDDEDFS